MRFCGKINLVIVMQECKNKKILLVDDEKELLVLLEKVLFKEGFYHIYTAANCRDALRIAKEQAIALFVLDVSLPDGNGFALFRDIRAFSQAPVIFLTARGEADDRLQGLELGADDYIVKPFLPKELVLRVTAVLKRTYRTEDRTDAFRLGERTVDLENAAVHTSDGELSLTAKEYILLKKLYENKNRIVTNDALCLAAWGDDYYGYENTQMEHIRRLREKIEENPSAPRYLITARGLGYKLVMKDE